MSELSRDVLHAQARQHVHVGACLQQFISIRMPLPSDHVQEHQHPPYTAKSYLQLSHLYVDMQSNLQKLCITSMPVSTLPIMPADADKLTRLPLHPI